VNTADGRQRDVLDVASPDPETRARIKLALELLRGGRDPESDVWKTRFLSDKTTPTEDDARWALALLLWDDKLTRGVRNALAEVFAPIDFGGNKIEPPTHYNPRKAVLKSRGKGHEDPKRDSKIYDEVAAHMENGATYADAIELVADRYGKKDSRTIGKIYAWVRGKYFIEEE
jgi:hypothetical protein